MVGGGCIVHVRGCKKQVCTGILWDGSSDRQAAIGGGETGFQSTWLPC